MIKIIPRRVDGVRSAGRAGSLRARRQRYECIDDDVRCCYVDHGMAEHVCPAFVNKLIKSRKIVQISLFDTTVG